MQLEATRALFQTSLFPSSRAPTPFVLLTPGVRRPPDPTVPYLPYCSPRFCRCLLRLTPSPRSLAFLSTCRVAVGIGSRSTQNIPMRIGSWGKVTNGYGFQSAIKSRYSDEDWIMGKGHPWLRLSAIKSLFWFQFPMRIGFLVL